MVAQVENDTKTKDGLFICTLAKINQSSINDPVRRTKNDGANCRLEWIQTAGWQTPFLLFQFSFSNYTRNNYTRNNYTRNNNEQHCRVIQR